MALSLGKSKLVPRPAPRVTNTQLAACQLAGAYLFRGPDTRKRDYIAYLSIPAIVREAAKRGAQSTSG